MTLKQPQDHMKAAGTIVREQKAIIKCSSIMFTPNSYSRIKKLEAIILIQGEDGLFDKMMSTKQLKMWRRVLVWRS